jgi:predicted GIY-YIG superfamily endonuclease
MGQDLPSIVTRVTSEEEDSDYYLWTKEQVIVLLSRTHYAKDIIFVGDPLKTAEALADCLGHVSQYTDYMSHIMDVLSSPSDCAEHVVIDPYRYNPFRMCDYQIPNSMSSFCYNLVSLGDPTHTTSYIGETNNLAHRFAVHNQRNGATTTKDIALIPWALLGYVTGFEGNERSERQRFETAWKGLRDRKQYQYKRQLNPQEIGGLAVALIKNNCDYRNLSYVRCGAVNENHN